MDALSVAMHSFAVPPTTPEIVCVACLYATNASFVHVHEQLVWAALLISMIYTALVHINVGGLAFVAIFASSAYFAPMCTISVLTFARVAGIWKKKDPPHFVSVELETQYSDANVENGLLHRHCF